MRTLTLKCLKYSLLISSLAISVQAMKNDQDPFTSQSFHFFIPNYSFMTSNNTAKLRKKSVSTQIQDPFASQIFHFSIPNSFNSKPKLAPKQIAPKQIMIRVHTAIYSSSFTDVVKQVEVSEDEVLEDDGRYKHIKAKEWIVLSRVIDKVKERTEQPLENPRKHFEAICQYVQAKYIKNKKTSIKKIKRRRSLGNVSIDRFVYNWNQSKKWTTFFRIMKNEKGELYEILQEYNKDQKSTVLEKSFSPYVQQQKTLVQRNVKTIDFLPNSASAGNLGSGNESSCTLKQNSKPMPTIQELLNP